MKDSRELERRIDRLTTWAVLVGALTGFAVVTTTAAPWWVWLIGMFVPLLARVGLMWWVVLRGDGNQSEKPTTSRWSNGRRDESDEHTF